MNEGQEIEAILQQLNAAGWETGYAGGPGEVLYWARHRQSGQVLTSRAPAIHAGDAVRWLATRCGIEVPDQPGGSGG